MAENILQTIAAHARTRVAADRAKISLEELKALCQEAGPGQGEQFVSALNRPGLSFLCEIKKASPSKGLISPDFPYLDIARAYEAAGADGVSCLTEPKWFLGSDDIFRQVRRTISLPMLRKDFTVDEYQIYQARLMGANAVLLIVSLLDGETLKGYLDLCRSLGLAALVETHDGQEVDAALNAGAEIIGVNNRNLKDFSVDFSNAARLRDRVPPGVLYVAESGLTGPEDAAALKRLGADAALVGEALMRAPDKGAMLASLRRAAE